MVLTVAAISNLAGAEQRRLTKNKNNREYMRGYYQRNKEKIKAKVAAYKTKRALEDPDWHRNLMKAWYRANKDHVREYWRDRRKTNQFLRLRRAIDRMTRRALNGGQKPGRTAEFLGCSAAELKQHLESLWAPGMTWHNYGATGWHIDHIRPLCSFDLKDPEQFKIAMHYTNLQPLWASDNLKKGKRYDS